MARFDTAVVAVTLDSSYKRGLLSQTLEYGGGPLEKSMVSFLSRNQYRVWPMFALASSLVTTWKMDRGMSPCNAFGDASRAAPRVRVPRPIRMPHSRAEICLWVPKMHPPRSCDPSVLVIDEGRRTTRRQ
jgi:hypothetical protein